MASLCSKKSTKIYHSVLGREDKRSLVACFDIWNECVPSLVMIFLFLCSLVPRRSPCIMQELEEPPLSYYDPEGYLVWVVFLCRVSQSPSERSACLRLNFAHTCLNSFSLLEIKCSFLFSCAFSRSGGKGNKWTEIVSANNGTHLSPLLSWVLNMHGISKYIFKVWIILGVECYIMNPPSGWSPGGFPDLQPFSLKCF